MFNPVSCYTSTTILAKPCLQKYLSQSYDSNTAKKHHYFEQNPGLKKIVLVSCNLLNSKKHMHFKDCSICMLWQNKWFHAIHLPERGKASHAVQFINFWWPTSSSYPISSSSFPMSSSTYPLSASSYLAPHCKLLIGCNYLAFPYKTFPKVEYIPQEKIISPNHIHMRHACVPFFPFCKLIIW